MAVLTLGEEVERSADPGSASAALERLLARQPQLRERLEADERLRASVVGVTAASSHLTRLLVVDPQAVEVLADLDHRPELASYAYDAAGLARWKQLELLRIAARDLTELDSLEEVGVNLSDLAEDVLAVACAMTDLTEGFAIIGMGKLGGRELNYSSDIDLMLVGDGEPRRLLDIIRAAWRVDVNLRPEGRDGPLVRSLASYINYWERWAETWEFQALLKARPLAGDAGLGQAFADEAAEWVWGRPFGAEELRAVRAMKARAEQEIARKGLSEREVKRGRGGIRDIEFAVQLLQLVHGRADPTLRSPNTLGALAALASGGYVTSGDAVALEEAYRFLRAVEHRLQLVEGQQVHAIPTDAQSRIRLSRVMGFRDGPDLTALERFEIERRRHQATVRSIHERLFFRPLLEAFTGSTPARAGAAPSLAARLDRTSPPSAGGAGRAREPEPTLPGPGRSDGAGLTPEATVERLAAFGFSEAARTRQAVRELTRGFSRSSSLMQQILPLALEWLSQSPDPDLGLLGLRSLATGRHQRDQLTAVFRESPEAARQICLLLGTGPLFIRGFERHPDLLAGLADRTTLAPRSPADLAGLIELSLSWRHGNSERRKGLAQFQRASLLQIAARDVLGLADTAAVGRSLTDLADVVVRAALGLVAPTVPFAVIAFGRFGGAELSYASDLDVVFVYDANGADAADAAGEAEAAAEALLQVVNGATPAARIYTLDPGLRPEGRDGPLARSLDAFEAYYRRWAQTWERQALLRARFVAGDAEVGRKYQEIAQQFLWSRPLDDGQVREIRRMKARIERERMPAGEDPQFHLKLGRGTLSDIEWTAQLLQLRHGVRSEGTIDAIRALRTSGDLADADARILVAAYRFCESARNRLYLVRGAPGDALPAAGPLLTELARSLGATPSSLREEYRRRTRRSREVMERLFYRD